MSTSEIKTGLDSVAFEIREARDKVKKAVQNASLASADLTNIATTYASLITAIQNLPAGDPFNDLAKDELAKLTAEFQSLKSDADTIAAVVVS